MNQEQVKNLLLSVEECDSEFEVLFTGKESKKVNGFYSPSEQKIYLHNKNFTTDNQLIYTALHEYAHHIQNISSPLPITSRCHTGDFYAILNRLVNKAIEKSIYKNEYEQNARLKELTLEIKEKYLKESGDTMIAFAKKLVEAQELCENENICFKDYANRILGISMGNVTTLLKISNANIDSSIGYENIKSLLSIPSKKARSIAAQSFVSGELNSPEAIKASALSSVTKTVDPKSKLLQEKKRIEKAIDNLNSRLKTIEARLLKSDSPTSE